MEATFGVWISVVFGLMMFVVEKLAMKQTRLKGRLYSKIFNRCFNNFIKAASADNVNYGVSDGVVMIEGLNSFYSHDIP